VTRLRVAIATESFLPTVNGVTTSVLRVLEYLRDEGHEAMVIAPSAGAPSSYAGFPVVEVPAIAYRQFPVGLPSPSVTGLLERFAPDVVHVASPFLLGAQVIGAADRLGIPSVAIFQTDIAGYTRTNGMSLAYPIAWRVIRKIHEKATTTLAPSTASLADLEVAGLDRLGLWGRGVDLERYHPRNRMTPAAVALHDRLAPHGELVVGYIGRIAPEKRIDRLTALRGMPNVRFAIVGDGPSRPKLERALAGMPVTWLGRLGGAELATAYAALDVFVHTGSEETFGQTVQEAQASGIPVVAPRAGGPIDLIESGRSGMLFEPRSRTHLRRSVEALLDPAARARMGEAGRRRVLDRSWAAVCDDLVGHYRDAIASAAPVLAIT
jgi:phosphatidylinositol alpha 1,6-mannosyltransferase